MVLSFCFVLLFLYETQRIVQKSKNVVARNKMSVITFNYIRSARIDSALNVAHTDYEIVQPRVIQSPFRNFDRKQVKPQTVTKVATPQKNRYTRKNLRVKGIALHGNGLVILEDEDGRTYIKNPGDTISGQRVIKISDEKVILRDKLGTYSLLPSQ